jgi:hypothetical protein
VKSYSKQIKRLLREYSMEAHERELHRELTRLDASFAQWREGSIGSGDLDHHIHRYKTGPARELWKRYNRGQAEVNVAYAIVTGILDGDEMPSDLLEAIARPLAFYQDLQERDGLREPGDWGR